jgi:hypothetical protein
VARLRRARPDQRRRRNQRLLTFVAALSAAVLVAGLLSSVGQGRHDPAGEAPTGLPAPTPTATPAADATAEPPVAVPTPDGGFLSWAMLDRKTGKITGSTNLTAPSDTMSMIKVWLAADYLRRLDEDGQPPPAVQLRRLSAMIRDSDNDNATLVYRLLGGAESIGRLVEICGLTESGGYLNRWSNTIVSARDTVRLGACIADGRAAGRRWTPWLLDEMRHVRGTGDFGVRKAFPSAVAGRVAIKNGWLLRGEDNLWHISCLAIGDGWVVGVLARYPARLGFGYGTGLCRDVGRQLVVR